MVIGIFLILGWIGLMSMLLVSDFEIEDYGKKICLFLVIFLISVIQITASVLCIVDSPRVITTVIENYKNNQYSPVYTIQDRDTVKIKYVLKEPSN